MKHNDTCIWIWLFWVLCCSHRSPFSCIVHSWEGGCVSCGSCGVSWDGPGRSSSSPHPLGKKRSSRQVYMITFDLKKKTLLQQCILALQCEDNHSKMCPGYLTMLYNLKLNEVWQFHEKGWPSPQFMLKFWTLWFWHIRLFFTQSSAAHYNCGHQHDPILKSEIKTASVIHMLPDLFCQNEFGVNEKSFQIVTRHKRLGSKGIQLVISTPTHRYASLHFLKSSSA